MKPEKFTHYLKNPSHLYQVSYQELKSLVVQYPFCQNLRYLLLTKSQFENSEDYSTDFELAATYHVDRSLLYRLIHQKDNSKRLESFVLNEDFLELKDLSNNSEEQKKLPILEGIEPTSRGEGDLEFLDPEIASNTLSPESRIPNDAKNDISNSEEKEIIPGIKIKSKESSDLEFLASPISENNISDEADMISFIEKPKKNKSVIDQLLEKTKNQKEDKKFISPTFDDKINLEDELESPTVITENDFKDLTPIRLGKDVLLEITNKTEKEMDAPLQKANQSEERILEDKSLSDISSKEETKNEDSVQHNNTSSSSSKNSFKSYLDQLQAPVEFIKEIKKETGLTNAINEVAEEEKNGLMFIRKKKSKKKRNQKKLMSKIKMKKVAKGQKKETKEAKKKKETKESKEKKKETKEPKEKKEKKKRKEKEKKPKGKKGKKGKKKVSRKSKTKKGNKKKKAIVIAEANKSVQQSDDILSETLAELLAKQGSHKKAIQMYKRLSLIFPKKSSFFAKKIAKLKK